MPTALRSGPYRIFFYSGDCDEPPHMHVERDDDKAKFWLLPVRIQQNGGFSRGEVNQIQRILEDNEVKLMRRWDEHCPD